VKKIIKLNSRKTIRIGEKTGKTETKKPDISNGEKRG
jgi:hypothetical protein